MSCTDNLPKTIWIERDDEKVIVGLIDQRLLPNQQKIIYCTSYRELISLIQLLALRGAPAIGVGGAMAVALWICNESSCEDIARLIAELDGVADEVANARPTAVNLSWSVHRVVDFAHGLAKKCPDLADFKDQIFRFVSDMADEDEKTNRLIGQNGAEYLRIVQKKLDLDRPLNLMTHCNAGSLATVFYGTALGVVYSAFDQGIVGRVYCCETRPVNQGGRLSAWELSAAGIPTTLICDSMSATLLASSQIDAVIVGADRIAANGDTANKIGTFSHALAAKAFGIPFFVAAPKSTIDNTISDGSQIDIENRSAAEIRGFSGSLKIDLLNCEDSESDDSVSNGSNEANLSGFSTPRLDQSAVHAIKSAFDSKSQIEIEDVYGSQICARLDDNALNVDLWVRSTPEKIDIFNPAFDVTPSSLISAIITEDEVILPDENGAFHL